MTVPVLMPHQRDHFELIKKSNHKIDLDKLIDAINNIPLDFKEDQLSLQMRKETEDPWYEGCGQFNSLPEGVEADYNLIIPELKGTYIEEMFLSLPFKPFRSRLMQMQRKSCYSIHADWEARYHIAIFTNPLAKFIFTEKERVFHIPADGYLYWVDTREEHTVINGTLKENEKRLHLVMGIQNQ